MRNKVFFSMVFFCVFILAGHFSLPAVTIDIPWYVTYGSNNGIFSVSNSTGVIVAEDGYIYTTGYSYGWDVARFGSPLFDLNSLLDVDIFVAKWNSNGALQWYTFLGGNFWDYGEGIDVDSNGNVYVTGSSYYDWSVPKYGAPVIAHQNPGSSNAFVAKLSPQGQLIWYTFLGSTNWGTGTNIKVTRPGSVFVSGHTSSAWNTLVYGDPVLGYNGVFQYDIFVARLNTNGQLQWYTFLGSDNYDYPSGLTVAPGDTVFVTGQTYEIWNTGKYGDPLNEKQVATFYDGFIAKLNGYGEFQWYTFIGEDKPVYPMSVDFSPSGTVFVTGFTQSLPTVPSAQPLSSIYSIPDGRRTGSLISTSAFVTSYTFDGVKNWYKTPYIDGYSIGASIDVGPLGDLFVTGSGGDAFLQGNQGFKTDISPVNVFSAYLMKMSPGGNVEWIEHFQGYPFGMGNSVVTFDNGLIYVTGNCLGFGTPQNVLEKREKPAGVLPVDSRVFLVQVNQLFDVNVLVKTGGGTVENDHYQIRPGQDCLINIYPDAGYEIARIVDNGTEALVSNPYQIMSVNKDHEIEIYFRLIQYPPELLLTGIITADNAWILEKDFADLTITIIEHATSPMDVKAYVLYKYIDGEWKELTRYTEAGVYNYKDASLTSGDEMYILKALGPDGSVIAESDILIL